MNIVWDTETTGLDEASEIVAIAAVEAATGRILLNHLVRPRFVDAWPAVEQIHGITPECVAFEQTLPQLWPQVASVLALAGVGREPGDPVVQLHAYNAEYDCRLVAQSLDDPDHWDAVGTPCHCLMLEYARHVGEMTSRGGYRWHRLVVAAERIGYVWPSDLLPHSAVGDVLAAAAVWRYLRGMPVNL